jgi:hypothetical protein
MMKRAKTTAAIFVILLLLLSSCSCCATDWHGVYCSIYCEAREDGLAVDLCIQSCLRH